MHYQTITGCMFVCFTTTDINLHIADAVIWCPCYTSIITGATLELNVSQTRVVTKISLRLIVRRGPVVA
jgi:hypothetical protein